MRIAIVALTDFQSFPTGGILTFVRRFVEAIAEREGVETALIGWSPREADVSSARAVRLGSRDHEFVAVGHGRLHGPLPDRIQFFIGAGRWAEALDRVGDVDAYYCHSPEAALRVVKWGCGAPVALHIHGAINTVGKSRFALGRTRPVAFAYERLVLGPAFQASKAVFATVSDPDFALLRQRGYVDRKTPCIRVPAMVNRPPVPATPRESEELRLVCVGRLEPIKGIDLVIQAVANLKNRAVPCGLSVIGDGTSRPALERLSRRLGVEQQVRFPGVLSEDGVQQALGEADVFVSGSHQEGFSLALLEALAQGVPAVVTDVGSARDVVRNGITGYVIDRRDPGLFAEKVLVASAEAPAMRPRCIQAAEPYSSRAVSGSILDTLTLIANGRRTSRRPGPPEQESARQPVVTGDGVG